jgi:hypothetical protein
MLSKVSPFIINVPDVECDKWEGTEGTHKVYLWADNCAYWREISAKMVYT